MIGPLVFHSEEKVDEAALDIALVGSSRLSAADLPPMLLRRNVAKI